MIYEIPLSDPRHPMNRASQDWVDLDGTPQDPPTEFHRLMPVGPHLIEDSYGDPRWSDGAPYDRHSKDGR